MSKFRIYRADSADPRKTGRENRKLYMAYTFLMFLLAMTINIHINSETRISSVTIYLIASIIVAATAWMFIQMKKQSKALHKIGLIEFTKTTVRKQIGDLTSVHSYNDILKIEIERHLHAMSISVSKTGSLTQILKIIYKDLTEENFIISDRSIDFGQKIGISDTLKTLRSTTGLDFMIKNN